MKKTISILLAMLMITSVLFTTPFVSNAEDLRKEPEKLWLIKNRESLKNYLIDWGNLSSDGKYYTIGYYTGDITVMDTPFNALETKDTLKDCALYSVRYYPTNNTLELDYTLRILQVLVGYNNKVSSNNYHESCTKLTIPVNNTGNFNIKYTYFVKDNLQQGKLETDYNWTSKINPFTYTNNTEMELIYNGFDGETIYNNTVKNETGCLKTEMKHWVTLLNDVNSKTSETTSIEGLGFSKYCTRHNDIRKTINATCTEGGYDRYTCIMCGTYYYTNTTKATGHNFGANNQSCAICGVANPNYLAPTQPTTTKKPKATSIKKLKKGKKSFKATWKKISGVSGYQVQYATDKKFKKNTKTVTIKKNTSSATIKKLKANKKYYVRVRTYKNVKVGSKTIKVYSSWSKVKTVTTKK